MKVLTESICQYNVPFSFAYKLICVDDEFAKPIVFFRDENATYKFIEIILLKSLNIVKK